MINAKLNLEIPDLSEISQEVDAANLLRNIVNKRASQLTEEKAEYLLDELNVIIENNKATLMLLALNLTSLLNKDNEPYVINNEYLASSFIAYELGITPLDPYKHGLQSNLIRSYLENSKVEVTITTSDSGQAKLREYTHSINKNRLYRINRKNKVTGNVISFSNEFAYLINKNYLIKNIEEKFIDKEKHYFINEDELHKPKLIKITIIGNRYAILIGKVFEYNSKIRLLDIDSVINSNKQLVSFITSQDNLDYLEMIGTPFGTKLGRSLMEEINPKNSNDLEKLLFIYDNIKIFKKTSNLQDKAYKNDVNLKITNKAIFPIQSQILRFILFLLYLSKVNPLEFFSAYLSRFIDEKNTASFINLSDENLDQEIRKMEFTINDKGQKIRLSMKYKLMDNIRFIKIIKELRKRNINVLPPDIKKSDEFRYLIDYENNAILLPLNSLR